MLDVLAHVPEDFLAGIPGAKGGMELIDAAGRDALLAALPADAVRAPGGSAANTVVGLTRLGAPARLLAKIGADREGEFYREHLRAAGVDVSALKVDAVEATGTCISLVTPDSERTMRTFLGASAALAPEECAAGDFRACTHVHTEGYLAMNPPLFRTVLDLAASCACVVCLDLSSPEVVRGFRDELDYALGGPVDVVFANEEEAAAYAGSDDPEVALTCLGASCRIAVVKLGKRGALIRQNRTVVHVPAEPAYAVDTTGAGDLWAAGFLYGLLAGWEPAAAGRLGAALGAAVVQRTGAVLDAKTWDELRGQFGLTTPARDA